MSERDEMTFDQHDGRCFDPKCNLHFGFGDTVVWLRESDRPIAYPFHARCAAAPWPLSEVDDGPQPWRDVWSD